MKTTPTIYDPVQDKYVPEQDYQKPKEPAESMLKAEETAKPKITKKTEELSNG